MKRRAQGFTEIDVLNVVVMIGALTYLATIFFSYARRSAEDEAIRGNLYKIWGVAQRYMLENATDGVDYLNLVAWGKGNEQDNDIPKEKRKILLQAVADENYDKLFVYTFDNYEYFTPDMAFAPKNAKQTSFLTAQTKALCIAVGEKEYLRYIKIVL